MGPRMLLAAALAAAVAYAPVAYAASPRYTDIVMSDTKGGKEMHAFKPATPKIYIHANVEGVSAGTTLKGDWIAVKTKVAPPNYKIDSVELKTFPLMTSVDFNMSKPTAGWPEGDYRVDLFIGGKKVTDVKFTVAK
jgi:hypothetical protein